MKCDGCGCQFPGKEAVQITKQETIGKGSIGPIPMTLCASCAASRRGTFWFLVWIVAAFVVGGLLCGLADWLIPS
jgi:hypothetical protein